MHSQATATSPRSQALRAVAPAAALYSVSVRRVSHPRSSFPKDIFQCEDASSGVIDIGAPSLRRSSPHTALRRRPLVGVMRVRHTTPPPISRVAQRLLNRGCPSSQQNNRMWARLQKPCSSNRPLNIRLNMSDDQSYPHALHDRCCSRLFFRRWQRLSRACSESMSLSNEPFRCSGTTWSHSKSSVSSSPHMAQRHFCRAATRFA